MPNSAPSKKYNWIERIKTLPLLFTPFERMLILTAAAILLAAAFPVTRKQFSGNTERLETSTVSSLFVADTLIRFPLDLNRASPELLELIPGIGKVTAQRIVRARRDKPFQSFEELDLRIRGIGPVTLERIRPFLTITKDTVP